MTITIKIQGIKELQEKLGRYNKAQIENVDSAVTTATFYLRDEVVESIGGNRDLPVTVDTGLFRNTVKAERTGLLQGEVSSDVEYAGAIEEYGWPPSLPARPHFRNSAIRSEEKIKDFIKDAIAKEEL